jgi:hypothetical protein
MRVHGPIDSDWTASSDPGDNEQATATRASAGVGRRNVCTGLTAMLCGGDAAPAAVSVSVRLIDGESGGAAYLWQARLAIPAIAGSCTGIVKIPAWIVGSHESLPLRTVHGRRQPRRRGSARALAQGRHADGGYQRCGRPHPGQ